MSEPAQTLGQRLKAERERRGMSTQKAADEMHLDTWVIDALETGDYQRIGPPVYAKGHLKKYATILGLPPAEIAAGFAPQPEAPVVNPAAQPMNIRTTRASSAKAADWPLPQIAARGGYRTGHRRRCLVAAVAAALHRGRGARRRAACRRAKYRRRRRRPVLPRRPGLRRTRNNSHSLRPRRRCRTPRRRADERGGAPITAAGDGHGPGPCAGGSGGQCA